MIIMVYDSKLRLSSTLDVENRDKCVRHNCKHLWPLSIFKMYSNSSMPFHLSQYKLNFRKRNLSRSNKKYARSVTLHPEELAAHTLLYYLLQSPSKDLLLQYSRFFLSATSPLEFLDNMYRKSPSVFIVYHSWVVSGCKHAKSALCSILFHIFVVNCRHSLVRLSVVHGSLIEIFSRFELDGSLIKSVKVARPSMMPDLSCT